MNYRASRLPKCYQIFIQRLIRFPPRLTVADCCCVGQIPGVKALHECDAWCCWKRTCMLSKTLPRIQGGGWCGVEGLLNKTTTTGPRQRSPLLGLIQTIRFRNSNTCGQSKFTQQLSSTWMIDGAATGLRHMSCRVKIWISALNLAPSIQLCHRPGAALPLMFDICLDAFTLPKKKKLMMASCCSLPCWLELIIMLAACSGVAAVEREVDFSWSTVWKSKRKIHPGRQF